MSATDLSALVAWAANQPWANEMRDCPQDAEWHAEGDVWTHTELVCAALQALPEWPDLHARERTILAWAALLHDVGKPRVTAPDETGRLRSPGHSRVGTRIARELLADLGAGYSIREAICSLIRYHSRPPNIHREMDPERYVVGSSWVADTRLLYLLERADAAGRRGEGLAETQAWIEHWREVCESLHCFGTPYAFANDHARILFYHNRLSSLTYAPHIQDRVPVTLIAGLPGVGKSTWLATHRAGQPVVELDRIRAQLGIPPEANQGTVIQAAKEACRVHLRQCEPFAFVATNVVDRTRQRWLDLFLEYGADVEIVYLECPLDQVDRQNRERARPVPGDVVAALWRKLDPPDLSECHTLHLAVSPVDDRLTCEPPNG